MRRKVVIRATQALIPYALVSVLFVSCGQSDNSRETTSQIAVATTEGPAISSSNENMSYDECSQIAAVEFEIALDGSFPGGSTPEEALEQQWSLVDTPEALSAATGSSKTLKNHWDFVWDLVDEQGVQVGLLGAVEREAAWYLEGAEWCSSASLPS